MAWLVVLSSGFGASAAGADEVIRFREAWGWAVVVPVALGASGAVHELLLDTGTTSTILEPGLATELGLAVVARANLVTPAGVRPVGVGRLDLALGSRRLDDVEVLIAELPAVRSDQPGVRGILGQSALARLEYTIDHARRRIVVHGRSAAASTRDAPVRPTLDVRLGCGRAAVRLVLDSGVATPVLFESGGRSPGLELELGGRVDAATNAGDAVWREGRLASLCVAGRRAGPVSVVVRPSDAPARAEHGLLPSRYFARVRLGPDGAVLAVEHW